MAKIFLRQDVKIWKNMGNGKASEFIAGPGVRIYAIQPTKKDPTMLLMDGRIFESGASERFGRTGGTVHLLSREDKISTDMVQVTTLLFAECKVRMKRKPRFMGRLERGRLSCKMEGNVK
jgi:hypothetical protein